METKYCDLKSYINSEQDIFISNNTFDLEEKITITERIYKEIITEYFYKSESTKHNKYLTENISTLLNNLDGITIDNAILVNMISFGYPIFMDQHITKKLYKIANFIADTESINHFNSLPENDSMYDRLCKIYITLYSYINHILRVIIYNTISIHYIFNKPKLLHIILEKELHTGHLDHLLEILNQEKLFEMRMNIGLALECLDRIYYIDPEKIAIYIPYMYVHSQLMILGNSSVSSVQYDIKLLEYCNIIYTDKKNHRECTSLYQNIMYFKEYISTESITKDYKTLTHIFLGYNNSNKYLPYTEYIKLLRIMGINDTGFISNFKTKFCFLKKYPFFHYDATIDEKKDSYVFEKLPQRPLQMIGNIQIYYKLYTELIKNASKCISKITLYKYLDTHLNTETKNNIIFDVAMFMNLYIDILLDKNKISFSEDNTKKKDYEIYYNKKIKQNIVYVAYRIISKSDQNNISLIKYIYLALISYENNFNIHKILESIREKFINGLY